LSGSLIYFIHLICLTHLKTANLHDRQSVKTEDVRVIYSLETCLQPTQVALGNFDGVHLGHQAVIESLFSPVTPSPLPKTSTGTRDNVVQTAMPHLYKTVVSFNPHPQAFFSGQPRSLLTVLEEKVQVLDRLGVEQLVLLPFDAALSALTPEAFVEQILVQQLKAQSISVGFNFCFGYKRSGTAEDLKAIAAQYSIPVEIVAPQTLEGEQVSSSEIRQALESGDIDRATRLLGRPYTLTGTVVQGQQVGRTIDFPTANLNVSAEKFIPRHGVYRVSVEGASPEQNQLGVMNIGHRPTVEGVSETIEVHLLDWSQDLYGHTLTVHLEQFLRPEQKFESLDALKAQIQQDCETARAQVI
jgi:riboflavin kinase / FMN adenylyltransferase